MEPRPLHPHKRWERIRIVVFDFDGTLADSVSANADSFARILKRRYDVPLSRGRDLFIALAGTEMGPRFQRALQQAGLSPDGDTVAPLVEEFFHEVAANPPRLFPNVGPALKALHQQGLRLCVSSANRPGIIEAVLRAEGLLHLVDLCLGQDPARPEEIKGRHHMQALATHYGMGLSELAQQALFVGDAVHDVEVARETGTPVVLRLGTLSYEQARKAEPDAIVCDLYGLIELLGIPRPQA